MAYIYCIMNNLDFLQRDDRRVIFEHLTKMLKYHQQSKPNQLQLHLALVITDDRHGDCSLTFP
ncbi:hypothetical protein KOY48_05085 [Candidatus Minimicrobia naudis]|uniref:Uncharacterized protein n=1 Tax=Candidatus Minimicrobia naudis TaxID=2841263 RepID=A0A8F1SBR0_9BACT|nr:hypothetical protein KOY48_05085 [Candidatus Minimicrobia naudis]